MEFENPKYHNQIVEDLMNGKFTLAREKYYEDIRGYHFTIKFAI